ncbi:MAG TPA: hypothetical protein VKB46_00815 [Pyrinomonadaceae bacterium]|nr:hypothetical protein [Pyrinomonadaceae bacterium]
MTKPECREIRRELDEIRLGAKLSATTMQHLQSCADCQHFQQQQTKLRQMVGSLGMVEAPADFDLQLRRRLANERSGSGYRFPLNLWPVGMRAVAVGAAIVLMFAAFIAVRQMFTPKVADPVVARGEIQSKESPAPKATVEVQSPPQEVKAPTPVIAADNSLQKQRGPVRVAGIKPRPLVAKDYSSNIAPVVRTDQPFEATPFTINASQQSLKLSLEDGSGVQRTISVPRVTFGSQRVLTSTNAANQFAPRGVW